MFIEIPANKKSLAFRKPVFGVGINDASYMVFPADDVKQVVCPIYRTWHSMLARCYSEKYQAGKPTYKGCSVCSEWLTFSNFRRWMLKQDWEGNQLDKDIKTTGNKIYSPVACIFVSARINTLLIASDASRGKYPIGVSFHKKSNKFRATCNTGTKIKYIGLFLTAEEAAEAYRKFKSSLVLEVATEQKEPLKGYLIRISIEIGTK